MKNSFTFESLQNLLFFPFREPGGWKKLLIAGVIILAGFVIPILPSFFVFGYAGLIMQRIIREKAEPFMPEWKNWTDIFTLGAKLGGASLIYGIPAIFFMFLGEVGFIAPAIIEAIQTANHPYTTTPNSLIGLQFAGMAGGMLFFAIGMLFILLMALVEPPVLAHVAATNSFKAAFKFGDWWKVLRANIGGFLIALILAAGIYMGVGLAMEILYFTIVLCLLIPFLMSFIAGYILIIANVLFAQAYREGLEKIAAQES